MCKLNIFAWNLIDADCAWNSQQDCPHLERWRKVVWQAVTLLTDETTAQRLVPLVPHPEIEAWLYLNHDVLEQEAQRAEKEIPCPPKGGWDGISDLKGVKDWQPWPRGTLNQLLAKTLPIDQARQDSPSLEAAVKRLMAIPQLKEILEKTWQYEWAL